MVRLVPDDGQGTTVVGVHPPSPESSVSTPVGDRGSAGRRSANVHRHPAASQVGRGGEGTWPSWAPTPLASPIDHVLVDPGRWKVINFSTERVPDSDHRLIISTLRPK